MWQAREVSYSELDALRQCRLKHYLAWRERWRPEEEALALRIGRLWHEVLAAHYRALKAGMKPPGIAQGIGPGLLWDEQSGASSEEQDLVAWMYSGHVEHYGIDEDWEVLDVEFRVDDWLPTERGTRSSFRLKGTIDLLVRVRSVGGLFVVDHKSCRDLPKEKEIDLDDQLAIYIYLLRRRGLDIRGAIYSAARKQKLVRPMQMDERFRRTLSVRQDAELEECAREAYVLFRDAYRPTLNGKLPPRSPNPDTCRWRCPFTEPCLMSRKGADVHKLLPDFGFEQDWERH